MNGSFKKPVFQTVLGPDPGVTQTVTNGAGPNLSDTGEQSWPDSILCGKESGSLIFLNILIFKNCAR